MKTITLLIILAFTVCVAVAQNSTCSKVDTCNGHGECKADGTCLCDKDYATVNQDAQCSYERKKQLAAFLLHTFLGGYGAGHFYINDIPTAMGQLSLSIIIPLGLTILALFAMCCCMNDAGKAVGAGIGIVWALCWLGVIVWWIVDMVRFANNYYPDSKRVTLAPW